MFIPRPSTPEAGRSLFSSVERCGLSIRTTVNRLEQLSCKNTSLFEKLTNPLTYSIDFGGISEAFGKRCSWFLVNVHIASCIYNKNHNSLASALEWFFGSGANIATMIYGEEYLAFASVLLSNMQVDSATEDLLPYVLEPHAPASRLSIMRKYTDTIPRMAKKKDGVFYTPSDVARFIVECVAPSSGNWLDPACGTGVFLREAIDKASATSLNEYISNFNLYGIDRSRLSIESCAFVLLLKVYSRWGVEECSISPYQLWSLIRLNLAVGDSLRISCDKNGYASEADRFLKIRSDVKCKILTGYQDLLKNDAPECQRLTSNYDNVPMAWLFPEAFNGFDAIVINPPYSYVVTSESLIKNWSSFSCLKLGHRARAYLPFVEMMNLFLSKSGRAAAITPLSISSGTEEQIACCRRSIMKSHGKWKFLFFDREPASLFGEDVKTRNAIITYQRSPKGIDIQTSGLLKWTSPKRSQIFKDDRVVSLGALSIEHGIPKLGSKIEVETYKYIYTNCKSEKRLYQEVNKNQLHLIAGKPVGNCVYLGSTAYNFINAFMSVPRLSGNSQKYSESPVHMIATCDRRTAMSIYALLVSRSTYWLWHAIGDGFHVTKQFLSNLPLLCANYSDEDLTKLQDLGTTLWNAVKNFPVHSVNGGRSTLSFSPPNECREIELIDNVIAKALGLDRDFCKMLDSFHSRTVHIDGKLRRKHCTIQK